jgi:hypothetical protein
VIRRAKVAAWLAAAVVAALALVPAASSAYAEGSGDIYPSSMTGTACDDNGNNGACRAHFEWRTNLYGPAGGTQVYRRTMMSVYLKAGEYLLMGSTAVGIGSGDIIVYNPGVIADRQGNVPAPTAGNSFQCSTQRTSTGIASQGKLTTRAQELNGPSAANAAPDSNHYRACYTQAATTGVYDVVLYGPDGVTSGADGTLPGDIALTDPGDLATTQKSGYAAWDLTVRRSSSSTTDVDGRVFTYAIGAFLGGNNKAWNARYYVTTLDGYRYRTDTNGLDPDGFVVYANSAGYLDPEGEPLNHDVRGGNGTLGTIQGGARLAPPEYPISFTPLDDDTLTALGIPTTPVPPVVNSTSFTGSIVGNSSSLGAGGTFNINSTAGGTYRVIISRTGNDFDPGKPTNRVLVARKAAGAQTITWNGKDNAGNDWPVGYDFVYRV